MNESLGVLASRGAATGVAPSESGDPESTPTHDAAATPEVLFQIASGFMAAKHLFIANEVGLFSSLAGTSRRLDELALDTGIAEHRLRIVADAMVSLGVLERHGEVYRNGAAAAAFLSGSGESDLRPVLRFWDQLSYPMWTGFGDAVRTGQGRSPGELPADKQRLYSEGVAAIQAAPAAALAGSYDFSQHERLLDLGGGNASWLLAVLQRNAGLRGTLFELPGPASLARQRLAEDPIAQRLVVMDGDFFQQAIPTEHDVVLIANVMHLFSPARNQDLLRRTRESVASGARLLLADFWTNPERTDPPFAALMAGEFLVITGEGDVYSAQQVKDWLDHTGWRVVDRTPLAGPMSLIVAEAIG